MLKNKDDLIQNLRYYYEKSLDILHEFGGPSIYFHIQCIRENKQNFLSDRHIELIYATLTAWGMHRMGDPKSTKTKLVEFNDFKSSILHNQQVFKDLYNLKLEEISQDEYVNLMDGLRLPYNYLKVSISEATIVANSKTLAHILPDLIPPVDRNHTIRFFTQEYRNFFRKNGKYKMINLPNDKSRQFILFKKVCCEIKNLLDETELNIFELNEDTFNTSYPKIMDNILMTYVKNVPKPVKLL